MGRKLRTDRIRHSTYESNHVTTTLRGEVRDGILKALIPLVRSALATGNRIDTPPSMFWFEASEVSGSLKASMGTGSNTLTTMTVRPPKTDGEPATVDVSMSGLLEAVAGRRIGEENLEHVALSLGDMERCLAWAWLVDSGFA